MSAIILARGKFSKQVTKLGKPGGKVYPHPLLHNKWIGGSNNSLIGFIPTYYERSVTLCKWYLVGE